MTLNACALPPSNKELSLQIYVCFPDHTFDADNVRTGLIEKGSMATNFKLRKTNLKTSSKQEIFEQSFVADNSHWRKFVIDLKNERKDLLVYELEIPKYIRELDWTEWKEANYFQQGNSTSFMVLHD